MYGVCQSTYGQLMNKYYLFHLGNMVGIIITVIIIH